MPAGLFVASDMVRACNLRTGRIRMEVSWVGAEATDVPTYQGPCLRAAATISDSACDALLIPGLWVASTLELNLAVRAQQSLVDALRGLPSRTRIWSYCAGVALAAASGRLDAHAATATWWLRPALEAQFGRVHWVSGRDLVIDRQTVTAAGPSGYLPLMLEQLAHHFDDAVLQDVREVLMLPSPRRRHSSFEPVDMMRLGDPSIRELLAWAQRVPAVDVTLVAAAKFQHVSVRTLSRVVDKACGMGAGEWLRLVKLSQAAEALSGTRTPVKSICEALGFGSEASLYRSFKLATGLTPSEYRQAY